MEKEEALLETALELFTELGFHGTPTSKIAKKAGVSNGTLFHYFPTKENLILRIYENIKRELNQEVEKKIEPNKSIKETFKTYFEESILWALHNQEKFKYIQQFNNSPFYKKIEKDDISVSGKHTELIETGKTKNELIDLPSELIYLLISHSIFGTFEYLRQNRNRQDTVIQKSFEQIWRLIT